MAAGTTLPSPRKLNPKLTRTTERVILRAMQIQPTARYSSVQEMRIALFNRRNTNPATDKPPTPNPTATPALAVGGSVALLEPLDPALADPSQDAVAAGKMTEPSGAEESQ